MQPSPESEWGEKTRELMRVNSSLSILETTIKRVRVLATVAGALAVMGFTCAAYFSGFAKADKLEAIQNAVTAHTQRISAVEEDTKELRGDIRWVADQLINVSRAVGAVQIPRESNARHH